MVQTRGAEIDLVIILKGYTFCITQTNSEDLKNDNLFIFTGGPGSGKTTLLETLHKKGFATVPETARKIIRDRLKKGLSARPEPVDFAIQIFTTDLENYLANVSAISPTFFDRSHVDSACMISDADPLLYKSYANHVENKRFNSTLFAFPPWEDIYQTDSERDQSFSEAVKVFSVLCNWYERQNYRILEVPKFSVEKRADFVLSQIS